MGQRYRDVRSGGLSGSAAQWIVEEVFRGTDGVQYARLACASDLTLRKTLAVAVLRDGRRFPAHIGAMPGVLVRGGEDTGRGIADRSVCRLYRGSILSPACSRFWTWLAPAPFARLSSRALTLQQFKFHKAISASAIGFVDRIYARSMPLKMDFLHRNSRICHRDFLLMAVLSWQSRPVNRKEAFRQAHPATALSKLGAS